MLLDNLAFYKDEISRFARNDMLFYLSSRTVGPALSDRSVRDLRQVRIKPANRHQYQQLTGHTYHIALYPDINPAPKPFYQIFPLSIHAHN